MAGYSGSSQNETGIGERVIPSSRRPDGTLRKEIRIRAGYVPQDEVERYVARGSKPRNEGPDLPPGVDPEYAAAQAAARKKAAKKNEKRKEKKAAAAATVGSEKPSPEAAADVANSLAGISLKSSGQQSSKASTATPNAPSTDVDSGPAALDKQLRNLRKKIRQAESLQASVTSRGGEATAEEQEKINRLSGWQQEAEELERKITSS